MKKTAITALLIAMGTLQWVNSTAQTAADFIGSWQNELGSTLKIVALDTLSGSVEGTYVSPEGTRSEVYLMKGWVNLPTTAREVIPICFSVNWGNYGSLTSWTGYLEKVDGKLTIRTLWHLIRPNTRYPFERLITGSDNFHQIID